MSNLPAVSDLARPVAEPDDFVQLVERIGASRHFRRAPRLRAFLEFVCRETLEGNQDNIHEHLIGHRVFGRSSNYDPTSDNIVRVEARELRKRLEAYFAGEGAAEPFRIRIPKGAYIPAFERFSDRPPQMSAGEVVSLPATPSGRGAHYRFLFSGLALLALLSAGLGLYSRPGWNRTTREQAAKGNLSPVSVAFWSKVFEADRTTLISLADSNLALLQDLQGEPVSLTDYTSGRFFASIRDQARNGKTGHALSEIASRYYTSVGDVSTVFRLMMLNRDRRPVVIRFARDVNLRDLKSRNVILLGSSRSNPWVDLFDKKRRFRIEHDGRLKRGLLRDLSPENETPPSAYISGTPGEQPYEAYGVGASVPNLDGTGHAMLIAGTNMQGTEAAGEFLTNASAFDAFLKKIEWRPDRPLPTFEVVLKLETMGGSSTANQIVAYYVPKM